MLATIVTANQGTAQFWFLVAAIVAAVAILLGIIQREWPYWPVLGMVVLLCLSIGLLFHA